MVPFIQEVSGLYTSPFLDTDERNASSLIGQINSLSSFMFTQNQNLRFVCSFEFHVNKTRSSILNLYHFVY